METSNKNFYVNKVIILANDTARLSKQFQKRDLNDRRGDILFQNCSNKLWLPYFIKSEDAPIRKHDKVSRTTKFCKVDV